MQNRGEPQPRAAIFVDAENQSDLWLADLMRQFAAFDCVVRRAYADWRDQRLDPLAEQLDEQGFQMVYARSGPEVGAKKNTADGHMARDARRVLAWWAEIAVVLIVSGDGFFVELVQELQRKGKYVVVAADPLRAYQELVAVADEFLPLGKVPLWIRGLDRLERSRDYVTFSYATRLLGMDSRFLTQLINRKLVIQQPIEVPRRGWRPCLTLNREALLVQAALRCTGRPEPQLRAFAV